MLAASALDAIGRTPLIELPWLRPSGGARILLKWEGGNPTGSMKDRMALAMVEGARRAGELAPGQPVVEYTGGSTGSSLAFVCAALGHPLTLITADCFAQEKIDTMRALGARVEVVATPEGKVHPGLIHEWKRRVGEIVAQTGAHWTRQMENARQLDGYAGMAEEILADAPGVTDFVAAVGTGGCAAGVARTLRERGSAARVHVVEPAECPYLTKGTGGPHRVEGIAINPRPPLLSEDLIRGAVAIPEEDGRRAARELAARSGLLAGTSTGLNLAAARRVAGARGPDGIVVAVGVDTGLKYLAGGLFTHAAP